MYNDIEKGEDADQDLIFALRLQIEENGILLIFIMCIEINLEEESENNDMIESFLKCYFCGNKPNISNAAEIPVY